MFTYPSADKAVAYVVEPLTSVAVVDPFVPILSPPVAVVTPEALNVPVTADPVVVSPII